MSVLFYAKGLDRQRVQMSNQTARIVLGLLGLPHATDDYLEGLLSVESLSARLGVITPEAISKKAEPPRRIDALEYDCGTSQEQLREHVDQLRVLVFAAAREGIATITWG